MKDDYIKFAIIGCGRIATRHIDAINKEKKAKLVAVSDLNIDKAKSIGLNNEIPFYNDYNDMFKKHNDIDVVSIMTPSGMHFEHAIDIIKKYKKNLLIEKPIVMTLAQARLLKETSENYNVKVFPVYQNRFNKSVQKVRNSLRENKELGKLHVGTVRLRWCRPQHYYDLSEWRGTWAMDGGALTNQGIHYIDLLRYICGEVKRVNAKLSTIGADIEVEDTGVAILEFHNGALGVIEIMTSARPLDFEASISCVCNNGLAVISGIATNKLEVFSLDPKQQELHSEEFPTVYGFGHDVIIKGVVGCLMRNVAPPIDLQDGFETIKLLHAIYRSDEIQNWVEVESTVDSYRLGKMDDNLANLYRVSEKKEECNSLHGLS